MPNPYLGHLQRVVAIEVLDGLYMESGYLNLLTTGPCTSNTARPAQLTYSPAMTAYINGTNTPLQGNIKLSADETLEEFPWTGTALANHSESKAVGCLTKLETVSDGCGHTYEGGGFCAIDKIWKKKHAQASVPSSMFSGKLRLMIQAIYGSKREDYEVLEAGGIVVPGKLIVDGFTLSAMYQPSYGLFTTADYEYYLVELTSVVKYYPILLAQTAQNYRDILRTHPRRTEKNFAKKIEAYILSTAKIDQANVITGGALDVVGGSVLYYGWHWKWDGSEADIVVQSEDYTNHRYNTTRYKLQISYVGGEFQEDLSVEESGYWWPHSGLNVFVPNPTLNKVEVKTPVLETVGNGIPVPATNGIIPSSPIHCFRSMSDELIVVRYSCNFESKTGIETVQQDWNGVCYDEKYENLRTTNYNGLNGSNAFSIGGESYNGTMRTLNSETYRWTQYHDLQFWQHDNGIDISAKLGSRIVCDGRSAQQFLNDGGWYSGWASNPTGEQVFANGQLRNVIYRFARCESYVNRYSESVQAETSYDTLFFLQIPVSDCSSVYWGRKSVVNKTNQSTGEYDGLGSGWVGICVEKAYFDGSNMQYMGTVNGSFIFFQYQNDPGIGTVGEGPKSNVNTQSAVANLYVYSGSTEGSVEVYADSGSFPLSEYFGISYFDYPYVDHYDWVQEDTSGHYKFSFKASTPDETDYPGNSAVGWV